MTATDIPGWLAALGLVVPAITGIVGYWLAGRNEEARDRRGAAREEVARRNAVSDTLEEKRRDFQLDLLLELQELLRRQARATARTLIQDRQTLRKSGQTFQLPSDISDEAFAAGIDLGRLTVRVLDDELRSAIEAFRSFTTHIAVQVLMVEVQNAETPNAAIKIIDTAQGKMADLYTEVNELLGVRLRTELGRSIDRVSFEDVIDSMGSTS